MNIIIFEDEKFDNLYPLTYFRPVFELRCGAISLRERIEKLFPNGQFYYFMRDYLSPVFKNKYGANKVNNVHALKSNDLLFINGRLLAFKSDLNFAGREEVGINNGDMVYTRINKATVEKLSFADWDSFFAQLKTMLPPKNVAATKIDYPWNLIQNNSKIDQDINYGFPKY